VSLTAQRQVYKNVLLFETHLEAASTSSKTKRKNFLIYYKGANTE